MDRAGELARLEAQGRKAIAKAGGKTSSVGRRSALPKSVVQDVFAKLGVRYPLKFPAFYPDPEARRLAFAEWGNLLGSLSIEHIRWGLENWREEWPPEPAQFAQFCRRMPADGGARGRPQRDPSRLLSNDARDEARRENRRKFLEVAAKALAVAHAPAAKRMSATQVAELRDAALMLALGMMRETTPSIVKRLRMKGFLREGDE